MLSMVESFIKLLKKFPFVLIMKPKLTDLNESRAAGCAAHDSMDCRVCHCYFLYDGM